MSFVWFSLLGILMAAFQVGLQEVNLVLAYLYALYLFYPFRKVLWVVFVTGTALDTLMVNKLGQSSLVFLLIIGGVNLFAGAGSNSGRQYLRELAIFIPFSVIDGIISGSFARFVYTIIVFSLFYFGLSFWSDRADGIMVRRGS